MSKVKRYGLSKETCDIEEGKYGCFVYIDDYEKLENENKQLKSQVECLTKAGDAIYQSFDQFGQVDAKTIKRWQTAKDGKDTQ